MSDTSLDGAIDVVAREMTALDAPAGIRANVLARIAGAARPGSALLPRWAWAAGVTVIVVAAAATLWIAEPGNRPDSITARQDATPLAGGSRTQPQPLASGAPAGPTLAANARRAGGDRQAARDATAVEPGEDATVRPEMGPPALAQPDAIVLAALGPDAIHIQDIGIAPIGDLKPITIQDIPVGSGEPQSPSIHR